MSDTEPNAPEAPAAAPRQSSGIQSRAGVLLMMGGAVGFIAMFGFVKHARTELDALEVMAWRGILATPLVWLLARRKKPRLRIANKRVFGVRVVFGFVAMFCYFTAARGLAVADLSLVHKLQPIVVALLAPLLLGSAERPGWRIWVVTGCSLVGCTILLTPQLQLGSRWGLWALGGALSSGIAHLCLRKLGETDEPAVVVYWFQLLLGLTAALVVVVSHGGARLLPPPHMWPVLMGVALGAASGQLLMTMAYQRERASVVAAAGYVAPLWAVLVDLVVFGLWPTQHALLGGSIIVCAGLWLVFRTKLTPPPLAPP